MLRSVIFFLLCFVLCLLPLIKGKVFAICELFLELNMHGFAQNRLKDWICLIEAESSRKTDAIGRPDADGSYDYGLFQINDRYWCSNTTEPGKGYNVTCQDLLSDDITKASVCAMKIYKQQGFSAWVGWVHECKGKHYRDVFC